MYADSAQDCRRSHNLWRMHNNILGYLIYLGVSVAVSMKHTIIFCSILSYKLVNQPTHSTLSRSNLLVDKYVAFQVLRKREIISYYCIRRVVAYDR